MPRLLLTLLLLAGLGASAQSPPVILLNGFDVAAAQGGECVVQPSSASTFGELEELLEIDGREVFFFDNCEFGTPPIERLGARLGERIDAIGAAEVDLVGHSMGGLIIRAYLAGKQPAGEGFDPPEETKVRKAVFLGTPHFGSPLAGVPLAGEQLRQLRLGSRFSWELATWNQGLDDLREVDALAVVGSGGLGGRGDGVVGIHSASLLSFEGQTAEQTRVIPACHNPAARLLCEVTLNLADVDVADHPTAIAVRAFLADDDAWTDVGMSVSDHPETQELADVLLELRDASNALIEGAERPVVQLPDDSTERLGPGEPGLFHRRDLPAEALPVAIEAGSLGEIMASIAFGANRTRLTPVKLGPRIIRVVPSAGLVEGLSLAPDSLVSIFGEELTDMQAAAEALPLPTELAGVRVLLDEQPLGLLFAGPGQVNILFAPDAEGLHTLTLESTLGSHAVRVLLEPAVPAIFTLDGSGTGPAAALDAQSFELIGPQSPIPDGGFVALYLTGIGKAAVEVLLDGEPQTTLYAGPAPGFPGLQQINFQVQAAPGEHPLVVQAGERLSNTATLAVGTAAAPR